MPLQQLKCMFHFPQLFLLLSSVVCFSCNQTETIGDTEKPEDNRFTRVVLAQGFNEPMTMTFLNDGRILIIERKGALKSFDPKTNQVKTITTILVNTKYTSKEGVVSE